MTVLAATNRPMDLDEALRRRLEKRIYIPLPSTVGRRRLFEINLQGVTAAADVKWDVLVADTDGYSGADIANACRDAAMMPMRKKIAEGAIDIDKIGDIEEVDMTIEMADFVQALKNVSKSVSQENLTAYKEWMAEYGCT